MLHISDIHLAIQAWPIVKEVAKQYHVAFIVDTGDLADHGTPAENQALAPIGDLGVPYVYVKGNHDSASTVADVASLPNTTVLDDTLTTIDGITVAGAGDPRLTPDKLTRSDSPAGDVAVINAAVQLADYVAAHPGVELVMFHDPHGAAELDGYAPTLLFGHLHQQYTWLGQKGSRIFVQGSTGGAGLRALQGETPTPVTTDRPLPRPPDRQGQGVRRHHAGRPGHDVCPGHATHGERGRHDQHRPDPRRARPRRRPLDRRSPPQPASPAYPWEQRGVASARTGAMRSCSGSCRTSSGVIPARDA